METRAAGAGLLVRMIALKRFWLLGGLMALYLILTLGHLDRPGYVHDTLQNEIQACRWAEQLKVGVWGDLLSLGFGKTKIYHGNITSYLMWPAFYVFGRSWTLVRVWPIMGGLLTLLMTFLFARRIYGERVALGAVALLVIHSPFIIGMKVGYYQVSSLVLYSTAGIYLLTLWWDRERFVYLAGAVLLLSFGLGSRLWFSWVIAGIAVVGLLWSPAVWRKFRLQDWRQRWKFIGAVCAGFLPLSLLLLRNLQRVVNQLNYLFSGTRGEGTMSGTVNMVVRMVSGEYFFDYCFGPAGFSGNGMYAWIAALSVAGAGYFGFRRLKNPGGAFSRWAPLAFIGTLFAAAVLSPKRDGHHLFVIYPFPALFIAMTGADLLELAKRRRGTIVGAALIAAVLAASELFSLASYVVRIHTVGGMRRSSMAVYDLARWVREEYRKDPGLAVVSTQEVMENLFFLAPEVPMVSDWVYIMQDDGRKISPSGTITFIRPGFSTHNDVEPLLAWQRKHGRRFREIAAFRDRDGYEMFNVYQWDRDELDPRYNRSIWPSG